MNEPNEKQRIYAETLSLFLDIPLPKEETEQAYWEFIVKYHPMYRMAYKKTFMDITLERNSTSDLCYDKDRIE